MSSDRLIQLANAQASIYAAFPLPVITYLNSCAFVQGNALADQRFAALCSVESVRALLDQIDAEWLQSELAANGSAHTSAVFAGQTLDLHILPILHEQTVAGLLLFILNEREMLVPEETALTAQMSTLLGSGVRESIGEIFSCIDLLSLKSDLLGSNLVRPLLEPITANCYRILRITNNLSLYLRLTAQNVQPSYSSLDISEYLMDIAELVRPMTELMHIPIEFSAPDVPCILHADHALLQLALINLLHNSLYFTRTGNHIHVSLERAPRHYTITVKDQGQGIAPQHLEKIWQPYTSFDPFQRGMGLGLTLARHIVELHGGEITLESTLDVGTTVTITLPTSPLNKLVSFAQQPDRPPLNDLFSELCIGLADTAISPFQPSQD